jgi:hypothetical protein
MREHFDPRVLSPQALAFIRACQGRFPCHLGGGTALSGAWLSHRLSRDIDLFCHDDVQHRELVTELAELARSVGGSCKIVRDGRHHEPALAGLQKPPPRLRARILCPEIRRAVGGLGDIETPIEQLANLPLSPACVLVVENLDTGLALPELPGGIAFMKLGNGVGVLAQIPWAITSPRALYWGDIDTHGFACLSHARAALPALTSLLMDEPTLFENRHLWGREALQYGAQVPHRVTGPAAATRDRVALDLLLLVGDALGRGTLPAPAGGTAASRTRSAASTATRCRG